MWWGMCFAQTAGFWRGNRDNAVRFKGPVVGISSMAGPGCGLAARFRAREGTESPSLRPVYVAAAAFGAEELELAVGGIDEDVLDG